MNGRRRLLRTITRVVISVTLVGVVLYASMLLLNSHAGRLRQASAVAVATPSVNPGNLTDAQRNALYQQEQLDWQSHLTAWLASLDLNKIDLRALPRHDVDADPIEGQPSLQAAVRHADVIVAGTVLSIQPTPDGLTSVTLKVDQMVKGAPVSAVVVLQYGGLQPKADWSGPDWILQEPGEQLMLPGDEVVLLLQSTRWGYEIQSISGFYLVANGVINADSFNDWRASIDGLTEAQFISALRAAE